MSKIMSKWYLYLAGVLLSVTAFCVGVSIKTNPKPTERINFVIGAFEADIYNLDKKLSENKPDGLKVIEGKFHYISASNFGYIFSSLRGTSDFFILPEIYVESDLNNTARYAANLDEDYIDSQLGKEFEYYSAFEHLKGIKIFDSETQEGYLKDYITYETEEVKSDYYLFFTYNSSNIGEINNSKSVHAFEIVKKMLKL